MHHSQLTTQCSRRTSPRSEESRPHQLPSWSRSVQRGRSWLQRATQRSGASPEGASFTQQAKVYARAMVSGDGGAMADDHVVVVWRDRDRAYANDTCFDAGASPTGEVHLALTNVRVPLLSGPVGPFNITTLTASGAAIDVLHVYVDVDVGWGRFAPSPPPPGASSAPAMRGGSAGALAATGVGVASALLLHRRRTAAL